MYTNVYPKVRIQSTINVLQKGNKCTTKIVVINTALYVEVSHGIRDRGGRTGQGKRCQVIGLELGNEKLSLICSGL